ncbi:MAG: DNA-directed RNA polymerase sigma-70 factor [Dehalococcoidia bacterium]|nr:MAG: DNA-directed RNA polymerase sigma-70 factor [Dehalococcoidia bacterium]
MVARGVRSELDRRDEELLARFERDDLEALQEFYDRHHAAAFGLALRMLGDRGAAEDVVQDAFVAAWRRAVSYNAARGSVRGWFLGIVRHRAIDVIRQRAGQPALVPIDNALATADKTDVYRDVARTIDAQAVRRALLDLPDEQRQTIELAYFKGLTCVEVADRMRVPVGTVKGRLRLAMKKLRAVLTPPE